MGFLFKSNKEKLIAIFDIGSGSIGGALVKIFNGSPTIITSVRNEITFHDELNFEILLSDMVKALSETVQGLHLKKMGAPKEIFCTLSSPWYISESRIIKIERTNSFVFNKKFADELIQKEIGILTSLYNRKFGNTNSKPELIENKIISVYLNGYKTDNPLDKTTKKVAMNMVSSLSPGICLEEIREVISKTFSHVPINSAYLAISSKYNNINSYLLINIGGEITDMAIISNGVLDSALSFPFGRQTFFRFLCKKLGKDINETKSLFSLYCSGTLEEEQKNKLKTILDSISHSWTEALRQSIESLPRKTLILPGNIFIIANFDIMEWFFEVINCEEYLKGMTAEQKCNIIKIDGPEFINICNVKNTICDPFLIIEAIDASIK
jgi:cell division ATPase FtsA